MKWRNANSVVEDMRQECRLWLPALTDRPGFSSSRIEYLLNGLVGEMPTDEIYVEVGVLQGRTLEAAAAGNNDKTLLGFDPCDKYSVFPAILPANVEFIPESYETLPTVERRGPVGLAFYDGNHSRHATRSFLHFIEPYLADEAVVVMDDWDRLEVRQGCFDVEQYCILREMPEYTNGLTCPPNYFGYYFGVALLGYRRGADS